MLGALAKYIFGGMMGDAPETTSPELQYHTREVNDWLLVDMPDQAIDDEDMDSESSDDDDDILTALPLLMAEEIVEPLQIMQSCEGTKEYSVCDNSYDKVQQHYVDKIHSVPSAVQHYSGDKIQGNFVDNIEAVSFEADDNLPVKIQDISANVLIKSNSDNVIQDQVLGASVGVQRNNDGMVQEILDDGSQSILPEVQNAPVDKINSILPEVQNISDDKVKPSAKNEGIISLKRKSFEKMRVMLRELEVSLQLESERILKKNPLNEVDYSVQDSSVDSDEENFCWELEKLFDNEVQESTDIIQTNLNERQGKLYLQNYKPEPINDNCVQRRLYSHVVQMGKQTQVPTDPMKDIFRNELEKNYDRCVQTFGDEIQESSDDEMNETSDDEMNETSSDEINYNSSDEMNENSDVEEENSKDRIRLRSYSTSDDQLSSDEESEEYLDDESTDAVDFHKRFRFVQCRSKELINEQKGMAKEDFVKLLGKVLSFGLGYIPCTEYDNVVSFRNCIPRGWYAYQTMQEPLFHALLVRNENLYEPTGYCPPNIKAFFCKNVINKKFKKRPLPVEEKPAIDSSLITNSAEILQNIVNQKSTNLPTKTAVVLEHIKELKPVQQAIQFDNRKYLTRSQLNRQNKNYMYQSSTKTNRRRNLQRNHSGANNNRKC